MSTRGGPFFANESTSWYQIGNATRPIDQELPLYEQAYWGWDSLDLGAVANVSSQTIGIIDDTEPWAGILGLSATNPGFGNMSLLATLFEDLSVIPTHSYAYTAGAYYRELYTHDYTPSLYLANQ